MNSRLLRDDQLVKLCGPVFVVSPVSENHRQASLYQLLGNIADPSDEWMMKREQHY